MVRIGRICILVVVVVVAGAWFWRKKKIVNISNNFCVVKYSYEGSPCHGNIVVDINGKRDTLKELNYCGDSTQALYRYTAGGDTIIKDDQNKTFTLRNGAKQMTFHCPEQLITQAR